MPPFRALWIDEGNDADDAKLAANGITMPVFSIRDPRVNRAYLEGVRDRGFVPGVYAAWNWWPKLSGPAFADTVSAWLTHNVGNTTPSFPFVCLDIETHDIAGYVLPCLKRWRSHRPDRVTDLTIEGHQGGLFTPASAIGVSAMVRYISPQCYNGAMTQVWDSFAMAKNLTDRSIPFAKVRPFYDAAHLPEWWEGYAFSQGRLP